MLLTILFLARTIESPVSIDQNKKIAVKTSQGLIKMNSRAAAELLAKLQADLSRHQGMHRTSKYEVQINDVIDQIKEFIKKNPSDNTMCRGSDRAAIIDNVLSDTVTQHQSDYHLAHAAVLSHDDLEYGTDSQRFDYLLRHIDILVHLLQRDVCDNGIVDINVLEGLLRKLDADLSVDVSPDTNFSDELGDELTSRYDPYVIPRLSLFESRQSQLEGFSVESHLRGLPSSDSVLFTLGPQNARNAQQRSQMFRENRIKLGSKQYNDEDMLYHPSYAEAAL